MATLWTKRNVFGIWINFNKLLKSRTQFGSNCLKWSNFYLCNDSQLIQVVSSLFKSCCFIFWNLKKKQSYWFFFNASSNLIQINAYFGSVFISLFLFLYSTWCIWSYVKLNVMLLFQHPYRTFGTKMCFQFSHALKKLLIRYLNIVFKLRIRNISLLTIFWHIHIFFPLLVTYMC